MEEYEVRGESVAVPLAGMSFPNRCLSCGAPANATVLLYRQRGLDLVLHKHVRFVNVPSPACSACKLRTTLLRALSLAPLAGVIAWWLVVGPLDDFRNIQSQLDVILWSLLATFLVAYYGSRRFAERIGFGVFLTDMTPVGDVVTIRCKTSLDALEIASLSRASAGLTDAPPPERIEPGMELGARAELYFDRQKAGRLMLIPLALILGSGPMIWFLGFYYPVLLIAGVVMLPIFGWRLLDRRPRLTISAEGCVYRPWGEAIVPWSQFVSVRLFRERGACLADLKPRHPEEFAARLPLLERLNGSSLNSMRPRFGIDLGPLDADPEVVVATIGRWIGSGVSP